ncbi:unnamed protein product [Symbiodinium sp. CCMP2592]|nr:unnamed protein product [Symbiodinium sp. CCMP2592]
MWGKRALWQLIFVDDLLWLPKQKGDVAKIMMAIFLYVLLGVPVSWKKFIGGLEFSWVGFALNIRIAALGLSASRAAWAINWLESIAAQGHVRVGDMRAALGRMSFALSALGHLRPFLGPIYAWVAVLDNTTRRYQLSKAIILVLLFLAKALKGQGRLAPVGVRATCEKELFRTDARAEGDEVWTGGWAMDHSDTKQCRWFSERLDHKTAPWLYTSGESYRQIASLELLATLAAVVVFDVPDASKCCFRCSAATDNKGNSHVLSRLLTTKFPLNAFLMELAMQLQTRGAELHLFWLPRLQNVEADSLTNNDTARFDPSMRLRFDLSCFTGIVLHDLLETGSQLYQEIRKSKKAKVEKGAAETIAEDSGRKDLIALWGKMKVAVRLLLVCVKIPRGACAACIKVGGLPDVDGAVNVLRVDAKVPLDFKALNKHYERVGKLLQHYDLLSVKACDAKTGACLFTFCLQNGLIHLCFHLMEGKLAWPREGSRKAAPLVIGDEGVTLMLEINLSLLLMGLNLPAVALPKVQVQLDAGA